MPILSWPDDTPHDVPHDMPKTEPMRSRGWAAWLLMAGVATAVIIGADWLAGHLSDADQADGSGGMVIRGLIGLAFIVTLRILRRWHMPL